MKYIFNYKPAVFFLLCIIFLSGGLYLNIAFSQKDIYFWVNVKYSSFLDAVMPWFTDIGNGVFCVIITILALFFMNIRFGLALGTTYALEGIVVQLLKQLIFTHRLRPWAAYADKFPIHLVPDFTPYSNNSFPSGHTATAFCMAAMFALVYPQLKGYRYVLLFVVALAVAYSRIYLSQHYFMDVYVGCIVGVLSSMLVYYYFYRHHFKAIKPKLWLDKTLLTLKG